MNKPNAEGLVPVYLLQAFGRNFPRTVAGFPEDLAKALVAKGLATWDLTGATSAPAEPPATEGEAKPKAKAKPVADGPVDIPANWQELHFLQQIKLAKSVAGPDHDGPMTKEAAVQIITAEVARRTNPEGVN